LSKLRHGQIMRLGAIIVIGVSIVAVSAKVLPALPQIGRRPLLRRRLSRAFG
jgi:hypothetical protein